MQDISSVVRQWIGTLNSGDVDGLIKQSEPAIAIIGPRGTAHGAEVLREWYAHTRLTFDTDQLLSHGNQVISLGTAHWYNDNGSEVGKAKTAFLIRISPEGLVAELSRHDAGLDAVLAASGTPNLADWRAVEV